MEESLGTKEVTDDSKEEVDNNPQEEIASEEISESVVNGPDNAGDQEDGEEANKTEESDIKSPDNTGDQEDGEEAKKTEDLDYITMVEKTTTQKLLNLMSEIDEDDADPFFEYPASRSRCRYEVVGFPKGDEPAFYPVNRIMNLTILFDLDENDWNEKVVRQIVNFVYNSNEKLLTLYFEDDVLTSKFGFPSCRITDIQYWARQITGVELTQDNFDEVLLFGTFDQYPERNALMLLDRIYSPIIYSISNWPDGPKISICQAFYDTLVFLTEFYYDTMGLSGLFVPSEVSKLDVKTALNDNALIARLDYLLLQWHSYIMKSTSDNEPYFLNEGHIPLDAYDSALNKFYSICGILIQLKSAPVSHICNILRVARSPYIEPFLSSFSMVQVAKEKSLKNAQYLKVLQSPSECLDQAKTPSEISYIIPEMLNCIKFVWCRSPYYNQDKQLVMLCSSLSNQIILNLKDLINVKDTFNLKPNNVIPSLEKNIACCENYKNIYSKAIELHNKFHPKPWNIESDLVFFKTDNFAQRCNDLLEISHTIITFGRIDETSDKRDLLFFWTRNDILLKVMNKVETNFWELFNTIKVHQDKSIDETNSVWPREMQNFRDGIIEIEMLTENAIQVAFEDLSNLVEGVDILQEFQLYKSRPKLLKAYTHFCNEVYQLFRSELMQCKKEIFNYRENVHYYIPRYSGRAGLISIKKQRLEHLHEFIKNSYWLIRTAEGSKIDHEFTYLIALCDDTIEKIHNKFGDSIFGTEVESKLKQKLLKRTENKLLYSTINKKCLKIGRETEFFAQYIVSLNYLGLQLMDLKGDLLLINNLVVLIIADYNYIMTKLSVPEKIIFGKTLEDLDTIISDISDSNYDWTSPKTTPLLTECFIYTREFKTFVEDYKVANERIYAISKAISLINFYDIPSSKTFTLQSFENYIAETKLTNVNKLVDYYNEIFELLLYVYDGFSKRMNKMRPQWIKYNIRIDILIQEAIRISCRKSMKSAYESLVAGSGEYAFLSKNIFLECFVNLVGKDITYDPMFMEFVAFAKDFLPNLVIDLSFIPRLFKKFKIKLPEKKIPFSAVIAIDEECRDWQTKIEKEIHKCYREVKKYEVTWEPFRSVWEDDRDYFIEQLLMTAPPTDVYKEEIDKFINYALNIKTYRKYKTIHILRLNFHGLVKKVIKHCAVWHRRISQSLLSSTAEEIEAVHEFCYVNNIRLSTKPRTLKQIPIIKSYLDRLDVVAPVIEDSFPEIKDKLNYLCLLRDDVPSIMIERNDAIKTIWEGLRKKRRKCVYIVKKCTIEFREELKANYDSFIAKVLETCKQFKELSPTGPEVTSYEAMAWLNDFERKLNDILDQDSRYKVDLGLLEIPYSKKSELVNLEKNLKELTSVWLVVNEWDTAWDSYKVSIFWDIDPQDMEFTAMDLWKKLTVMFRELRDRNWPIVEHSKKTIEAFKRILPLINDLKNPSLKQRHWDRIREEMKVNFDEKADTFTLDYVNQIKMQDFAEAIHEISHAATMEFNIETYMGTWSQNTEARSYLLGNFLLGGTGSTGYGRHCLPWPIDLFGKIVNLKKCIIGNWNAAELEVNKTIDINKTEFLCYHEVLKIFQKGFNKMKDQWAGIDLQLVALKDKGMFKLQGVDDIFKVLEDHQTGLSAMKATGYIQPFMELSIYWEKGLGLIMEVLEQSLDVQKQYLYLENIFLGEDIRRQLPREATIFDEVTASWGAVTTRMNEDINAFRACHAPGLLNTLNDMLGKLEEIQKSLEQYLETKRNIFPRFYFISNDDLLEILGNSNKPELIQPHFKKCFDNIYKVNMVVHPHYGRTEGVGMISAEGEYIPWGKNIIFTGPVELWLGDIEKLMKVCLRNNLRQVKSALQKMIKDKDKWVLQNYGQLCITASQIQWTYDCTKALLQCNSLNSKAPLKKIRKLQNNALAKYSEAIRTNLTKLERLKVVAIITIEIHARDVIEVLFKSNCRDIAAFEWQSQLKFYWERVSDDCMVRQTNTAFRYGYEYLGNSGRLVITPLTDRCYITLTTALHLYRGGSPKGPAGTGKTETVKDLGKALAYYVIVINCSEGLDYKSMGRMFSGFSQTGAWGCFDEFNRINIEVLSVVAQQILSILSALSAKLHEFVFEGTVIKLVWSCGIFITMNPGYAGRTELPDNLKSMFRPISMMVPDSMLIAENTLTGEGFNDTRVLAKKVFTLFSLCKQQLSKQDHYDFGLRGMVALLRYAGKKRRQHPKLQDEEIVLLAMKDMNVAKLTSDDLPLFLAITKDLFPSVTVPAIEYDVMFAALRQEFKKANLQDIPAAFAKIVQLYETKGSRHSVMIVGATGSAKSTTWKMLKAAMSTLKKEGVAGYESVKEYLINPKAVYLGELYGEYNLATGEWADGILSNIMRTTCADESKSEKWILFDGPVDAVWIENMNSVMDDNKVLTLINSERITMPEQVSLLFEVGDLAVASPATVSRCGIVFNDYKEFGWRPYFNSWLNQFKLDSQREYKSEITALFLKYVDPILEYKRLSCEETVPVPKICAVISLCRLLQVIARPEDVAKIYPPDTPDFSYAARIYFFFCVVWSLASSLNERGREKMSEFLIKQLDVGFNFTESIYEYYVNVKFRGFRHWQDQLPQDWKYHPDTPFCKIFVPSVDSLRYSYLTKNLLSSDFPVLITGSVGTGKTSCALSVLDSLDPSKYCTLPINMSAQTTSNNIQDTIMSRVEKRTKGKYYPPGGKIMVTFMDDFNMPAKECYGAQPPLELIRQWIDYEFWYNRQDQTIQSVKDMLLLVAMGPPGGGRNMITDRLLARFNVISVTLPTDSQIQKIFSTMLLQHLTPFSEDVKGTYGTVTKGTLKLFQAVSSKLLPTPAKMHYLFNLRDISRVFQGLLRANTDYQNEKEQFIRLWAHECCRVFQDRLIDQNDSWWFLETLSDILNKELNLPIIRNKNDPLPVFCDFLNQYNLYAEVAVYNELRNVIYRQMEEYNNSPGVVKVDLVLFREAINHVCRIARVISQPRGHILLVGLGGSGRQSLSRIAGYICGYSTFQIELSRNYRTPDFKEDLKRVYFTSGVKDSPVSFLFCDNQVAEETFLEILNNILSTGEVTNLYKPDEFEEIKGTLMEFMKRANVVPTTEAAYGFLIDRVRTNLHVVLCMSPVGEEFRVRLRQYPSLIGCTTIDWFHDWPEEALLEVANKFMQEVDMVATISSKQRQSARASRRVESSDLQLTLRQNVSTVCASIHHSVSLTSKMMLMHFKRHNYVTPSNFLELVAQYKENLNVKRAEVAYQALKLQGGLKKLIETRETVEKLALDLEEAKASVREKNNECEECMKALRVKQVEVDEKQKVVSARRVVIEAEEQECQRLADIAMEDLKEAMPALEAALQALDALNKKDLTEIKSYTTPPKKVEMVMEAVMVLLKTERSWAEAKRQLGDVNFLLQLRNYDKDHIPDKVLKDIGKYVRDPEFEPEKVGIVSTAAKSLAMWCIAIEKYGKVYRVVAPKKAKVDLLMASLREKQADLAKARAELNEYIELTEKLESDLSLLMNESEQLRIQAEELEKKLERSRQLVEGLMGEKDRWEQTVDILKQSFNELPGDCLIGTAYVSYMGPFMPQYRESLLSAWKNQVQENDVPWSKDKFNHVDFLAKPTQIRDWNIQGLPSDSFSIENGVIATRGSRWPLIIDPQTQAWKWIRNMERANKLETIDFGDPNYMKVIENALGKGQPILLQNVTEVLDPSIMPILNKAIVLKGSTTYMKLGDRLVPYNNKFKFYITTKLSNPHYPPEISTKTTLINFSIKEEGLESQLLGIVVRKERPILEEQKDSLVVNIAAGKKSLIELEDELLRLLSESKGNILENVGLFNTLNESRETSKEITKQLEIAIVTEKEIDKAREGYRICAKRAALLYFVLNDMSKIDPMYQFSLDSYVELFENSIAKYKKSDDLAERMDNLNKYHTYSLYKNTCRGLFEKHKLFFSFHICIRVLECAGMIVSQQYQFFLRGGVVLNRKEQPPKPYDWLTEENWDNLTELAKIQGFEDVLTSIKKRAKDWKTWFDLSNPEEAVNWPLPKIGDFEKLILVRSLRADRLTFAIGLFVSKYLGKEFTTPPILDIKAVLEDSMAKSPLIFVLSPGVDPTAALLQLAETSGMASKFHSLSLGQGQAPIATKLIQEGKNLGFWVFLANCHLSLSWMPALDKIVELLQSDPQLHPEFRLWLSSSPHPDFPLSILQTSLKMTTEPPKGMKANMKRLYNKLTDEKINVCKAERKYKRLLYALTFFHAVLIERKKFEELGWNVIYSFNDSDFEVSENVLMIYLDEYPDTPWDALKYLIAGVFYGGHVTDDWDRRLLLTYIDMYFTEDVIAIPGFKLCPLEEYVIPPDSNIDVYQNYIDNLPPYDDPAVFGQHSNADIKALINEAKVLCDTLMSVQGSEGGGGANVEEAVMNLTVDMLSKIPKLINYELTEKQIGYNKQPLDVVLLQEISRYNALLKDMRDSLIDLQKGIKGTVVMSSELEDIFSSIYEARIPAPWLRAYPSLKNLGSWIQDLINRVEFFNSWATRLQAPPTFVLAFFTFPTGFLTAVLQTAARRKAISIDTLTWDFVPLQRNEKDVTSGATEGVYVSRMFLEAAGWDSRTLKIVEPEHMKLIYQLPVIHFRPIVAVKKKTRGFYACPVYYYPQRCGTQGREAYVVTVDLRIHESSKAETWITRGTAILLSLAN